MAGAESFPSAWLVAVVALALFLAHAAAEVDGAGLLLGMAGAVLAVLGGALWVLARGGVPLAKRPIDLLCVCGFALFAVIAAFVDLIQAGAGPGPIDAQQSWAPPLLKEAFVAWARECDPLLAANPVWYWVMAVLSPLLYLPFYVAAIVAFAREVSVWCCILRSKVVRRLKLRGCATCRSCGARCCPTPPL